MAETRYFAIDPGSIHDDVAVIRGEEFHHLVRVLRARKGSEAMLLDGKGGVCRALLRDVGSDEAVLEIKETTVYDHSPSVDIAISAIKAPRLDLAVEKCSEIGLRRLILFYSDRSVSRPGKGGHRAKTERLRRKAISACKQSGQPFFPEISLCGGLEDLIDIFDDYESIFLADQGGASIGSGRIGMTGGSKLGIIGPEGGFTDEESNAMTSAGASPIALGASRLRSETAAICLLFTIRSLCQG